MSGPNISRKTTVIYTFFTAFTFLSSAQTGSPSGTLPPIELEPAKKQAVAFSTKWKNSKLDSAYLMMSAASRTAIPKATFFNIYNIKADTAGKLTAFTVQETLPSENEVIVKIKLEFYKESPPTLVSGVHKFHMVKENKTWMVKTIVPPIAPPETVGSGGGHPGE